MFGIGKKSDKMKQKITFTRCNSIPASTKSKSGGERLENSDILLGDASSTLKLCNSLFHV